MAKNTRGHKKKHKSKRGVTLEQIHAFAFGELGLTPYQYYCLTPYEFDAMVKGHHKRRAYEAAIVRKQTQLIYGIAGGKDSFEKYWPIEEIDGQNNTGITRRKVDALFKKARAYTEKMNKLVANN